MKLLQRLAITYIRAKIKWLAFFSKKRAAQKAFTIFCTPYARTKTIVNPKNAEHVALIFKKLTINGYRWNHPQPKKLLMLHGFGSAAYKFENYANLFTEKGYEVLAFDAPAHGRSDGKTTNAVEYSELVTEIIQEFGPVDSFLAHSFGGLALSLALENLPHDENMKIVFIAPATETTSAIAAAFGMLKIKSAEVRNEFEKLVMAISGKNSEWFSMRRAMHNINASVLWIHDEDDDVTPWADALKVKQDNHANIKFLLTKGLGHRKIYHDPSVKNKVTGFL